MDVRKSIKIGDYVQINKHAVCHNDCYGIVKDLKETNTLLAKVYFRGSPLLHESFMWYESFKLDVLTKEQVFLIQLENGYVG